MTRQYFTTVVKQKLKEKRMTQQKLAEIIGVTPAAVSLYITGKHIPKTMQLMLMCDVLGMNPSELTWDELEIERQMMKEAEYGRY